MVRNRKPSSRVRHSDEEILQAVTKVINKELTIREAADSINISKSTLARAVIKYKQSPEATTVTFQPNHGHQVVFTPKEETMLKNYILDASKFHCGLTKKMVQEFAFDYAKKIDRKFPPTWEENRMAGMLDIIIILYFSSTL